MEVGYSEDLSESIALRARRKPPVTSARLHDLATASGLVERRPRLYELTRTVVTNTPVGRFYDEGESRGQWEDLPVELREIVHRQVGGLASIKAAGTSRRFHHHAHDPRRLARNLLVKEVEHEEGLPFLLAYLRVLNDEHTLLNERQNSFALRGEDVRQDDITRVVSIEGECRRLLPVFQRAAQGYIDALKLPWDITPAEGTDFILTLKDDTTALDIQFMLSDSFEVVLLGWERGEMFYKSYLHIRVLLSTWAKELDLEFHSRKPDKKYRKLVGNHFVFPPPLARVEA